jgi:hypothetical protein
VDGDGDVDFDDVVALRRTTPGGTRWPDETGGNDYDAGSNDDLTNNWAADEDALRTIYEDDTIDNNQFITLGNAGF